MFFTDVRVKNLVFVNLNVFSNLSIYNNKIEFSLTSCLHILEESGAFADTCQHTRVFSIFASCRSLHLSIKLGFYYFGPNFCKPLKNQNGIRVPPPSSSALWQKLKSRSDLHNLCTIHNSEVLAMARFNTGKFPTPWRQEKIISCIWYLIVFVTFILCFGLSELYSLSSSKYCFFLFFIFGMKLLLFFCKVSGSLIVTFFFVSSTSLYIRFKYFPL